MKNINEAYKNSYIEVLQYYKSSNQGLNSDVVFKYRNKYGSNKIRDSKRKSALKVFLEQYCNLLVIVLIIASILSLFTGGLENTIVILIVITLNAILGTIEFFKAEKSIEGLKNLTSLDSWVIRDNKKTLVNSDDIVCGDYVILKSGDIVPADIRVTSVNNLEVDESMLTGESTLCEKNTNPISDTVPLGERRNILFRGTKIISGKAEGVVFKTGENTEIGKISVLMQKIKKKKSPLEKDIDKFSRDLAIIILIICVVVFVMSLYRHISVLDSLMFSISLAVAAIPEALQTIVTIVLAISTEKMAKEKAIVKDIKALETLGNVDVICTDKTGTLTQNKMTVKAFYSENKEIKNLDDGLLKEALILCNDGQFENDKTINTDDAILHSFNLEEVNRIRNNHKRIFEIPFTSKRKMQVTVNEYGKSKKLFVKGASDIVLNLCNLDYKQKNIINSLIEEKSKQGFRVLTCGYKDVKDNYDIKNDLIFLGLVFIIDPIKDGVKETIEEIKKYHVKPIMITGDHLFTAINIGKETGIYESSDKYLTGYDMEKMTDEEILNIIDEVKIYARVSPQDKIRIVTLLQNKGKVVAFLGDGVNDAPAIKKADVGVSMGISGTEVSKEASDVILMDDNLLTVTKAIKRGRKVYQNIQNSILFLIAGNIAGIFIVLFTTLVNLPIPFAPVHLLFINLINDSLPAIAIGIEESLRSERDILYPRDKNSPILTKRIVRRIMVEGFIIALFVMISYLIGLNNDIYVSRTMVFITITISRLFYSFNCRDRYPFFIKAKKRKGINKTLWISIFSGIILVNVLLFIPFMSQMFSIAKLTNKELIYSYILGLAPYITIQLIFVLREIKFKLCNHKKLKLNNAI